jgi:hypothetical protein
MNFKLILKFVNVVKIYNNGDGFTSSPFSLTKNRIQNLKIRFINNVL